MEVKTTTRTELYYGNGEMNEGGVVERDEREGEREKERARYRETKGRTTQRMNW